MTSMVIAWRAALAALALSSMAGHAGATEREAWPAQPFTSPCWDRCSEFHTLDIIVGNYHGTPVYPPPYKAGDMFRVNLGNGYFFRTPSALRRYVHDKDSLPDLLRSGECIFLEFGHPLQALEDIPVSSAGGMVEGVQLGKGFVVLAQPYEVFPRHPN